MKFISSKAAFAMVMLPALVATILMTQSCGKSGDVDSLYRDPSQPVEARVNNLLSQMTLEEKNRTTQPVVDALWRGGF